MLGQVSWPLAGIWNEYLPNASEVRDGWMNTITCHRGKEIWLFHTFQNQNNPLQHVIISWHNFMLSFLNTFISKTVKISGRDMYHN
jgi:hypothetical protein